MPATAALIGGGASLLGGAIKGLVGSGQKKQGNQILNGLTYPDEQMPDEINQNKIAAQQQAATGLPSEQYQNAMKNIQQQQLLSIQSAQNRRGGLGAISGIQQGTNDATLNLNAKDAQMKLANQQNLQNVNNQVAGWKSRLFNSNVRDKYNQQYSYGMGLLGAGNQNLYAGVDQGVAGAGRFASGLFGDSAAKAYGQQNQPQNQFMQNGQGFNYAGSGYTG